MADLDLSEEQKTKRPTFERPSFAFSKRNGVLVEQLSPGVAEIRFRPGVNPATLAELRRTLGVKTKLKKVEAEAFEDLLQKSYESDTRDTMQVMDNLDEEGGLDQIADELPEPADLLESEDDAPIIRLINAILTESVKEGASDIHIEPFENRLSVRFRIDGVLREVLEPPRAMAPLITSRLKVMAELDIAEKRLPQDGRISLRVGGRAVDLRVSTLPSGHGERIVMRLLDKQAGKLDLDNIGMPEHLLEHMRELIQHPHGIILVTGPTGSGKTTTLYAVLSNLNTKSRSILTVEDPIEYYLDGIGQTQVNAKVDMTFARGLRAILRQDPDVVMVGEIRDLETAEIAVQASLTGHLVLSTLHTNTAAGAVTRLRDMGIEPFLVATSLVGVLAQRLVRRLCDECKEPYQTSSSDCEILGIHSSSPATIFRPKGCPSCNGMGYKGRMGIYELVLIDEEMRTLIHNGAAEYEIDNYARTQTLSIRREGAARVLAGETSIEELLRVTQES